MKGEIIIIIRLQSGDGRLQRKNLLNLIIVDEFSEDDDVSGSKICKPLTCCNSLGFVTQVNK